MHPKSNPGQLFKRQKRTRKSGKIKAMLLYRREEEMEKSNIMSGYKFHVVSVTIMYSKTILVFCLKNNFFKKEATTPYTKSP